ncbi:pectin lyase-like protein [Mytilinidion resinicola]|uniref:pectate lyase n=1 Tax=Mytilinidion resinicola TaxID=574789 RepID=A0A6A6YK63_9PEZI|nr:pectin lyase-like protein [Mytilinidion resinicola]KAF2808939.1 pectin lyase-like protein [Mytilinidion resinicola]
MSSMKRNLYSFREAAEPWHLFPLSSLFVFGLSSLALAAPTRTHEKRGNLAKRASVTQTPTTGYATQNGSTTGGKRGSTTTVSTYAQFTAAVTDGTARIVIVKGTITKAARIKVGSNKSIIGQDSSASLLLASVFYIKSKKNVIVRNLSISKVLVANGDAIGIQASTNVWVDHCDVSSDTDHDKDYYDGLVDVTHASDFVTISNTFLHDHWKASLVGHSDSNGDEDTGHLRVTYNNNYWYNIHSRGPSVRSGTVHIYNSYYLSVDNGINTRDGAVVLVQSNGFDGSSKPLYSTDSGYAVASDNVFGDEGRIKPSRVPLG